MASSNRHWPSMFKSKPKPCNPHHHQWQHDITSSFISNGCHRSPYTSAVGCEERSPEPKPRWNPKPEQIRILEAIFNSGMVNPPRDEIRKIRAQLQEYGQVGDANVFYWFQNRKSRSKHKLRQQLQNSKNNYQNINQPEQQQKHDTVSQLSQVTAPSSSSTSSDQKSSRKEVIQPKVFSIGFSRVSDVVLPNSPTLSVNQNYLPPPLSEGFLFPVQHHGQGLLPNNNNNNDTISSSSQGFCFSELSSVVQSQQPHGQHNVGPCTSLLLSEIMNHGAASSKRDRVQDKNVKVIHPYSHLSFCVTPTTPLHTATTVVPPPITTTSVTVPSPINFSQLEGIGDAGVTPKSMVFINDVAFEVAVGPFNVREAFGDNAMLIHPNGHPVPTNQWGLTLHSLHHGASYYLIM
ncbi:PREDICTED: WUSCHEL-related homeobox 9-like [Lupinus angustifolius]|uniref:WUSCHEL-related homeobox 9-like n=1 Tax=Lupinus angustifolius TaxID=3871 RepID=UPI00092F8A60|nr:PREDICTED: WUSCHEL-related homeobox 9-like [Lupinus angustifolius]